MSKVLYCSCCGEELKIDMEIEYSQFLGEYYCSPDCATTRYFDYMGSKPIDKDMFNDYWIEVKDNVLYKK